MPDTPDLSRRALFRHPARLLTPARSPQNPPAAAPAAAPTPPPRLTAVIQNTCLAENGAYCRTCGEACPDGAIRFHLLPQGRARADVNPDRCTGCGDCLFPCPVSAIRLDPVQPAASPPAGVLPAGVPLAGAPAP